MVKRIVLTFVQFAAFLGLLFVGGMWDSLNLSYELRQMQQGKPLADVHPLMTTIKFPVGDHILIAQGLLFATVLLVLIVLGEALRKRLKPWAGLSVLAYVLALVVGFALKLGLPPAN